MSSVTDMREQVRDLKIELASVKTEAYQINRLLTTYLALSRRIGLPPAVTELIMMFQQGRIAIETMLRSIQLFYATSGPLGWLFLAGGLALGGLMLLDTFEIRSPEY